MADTGALLTSYGLLHQLYADDVHAYIHCPSGPWLCGGSTSDVHSWLPLIASFLVLQKMIFFRWVVLGY